MHPLARPCAQRLTLVPGLKLGLLVEDPELLASLTSLVESSGAELAGEGEPVGAAALELAAPPGLMVPAEVRERIDGLPSGVRVAICFRGGLAPEPPQKLASALGPRLRLAGADCFRAEDGSGVLGGLRRPALVASERKRLRGLGHALEPTVLIGKQGLSEALIESLRAALMRHGLVKAKLAAEPGVGKDDKAETLAWAVGAELVQRVGRVALFYRPDVPLEPPVSKRKPA